MSSSRPTCRRRHDNAAAGQSPRPGTCSPAQVVHCSLVPSPPLGTVICSPSHACAPKQDTPIPLATDRLHLPLPPGLVPGNGPGNAIPCVAPTIRGRLCSKPSFAHALQTAVAYLLAVWQCSQYALVALVKHLPCHTILPIRARKRNRPGPCEHKCTWHDLLLNYSGCSNIGRAKQKLDPAELELW